ncbi:SpoIIE family protein phosphatase [Clostridiaceae bacterium 35-E11]
MCKKPEKQLGKETKFFEDILSGMKDWVRVIDPNNKVIFMNEPMKQVVGDTVGQECFRALGKSHPCECCISKTAVFEGASMTKEEIVHDRIYSVVSSPIWDEKHKVYCAVEVFRDVTEQRAMEKLMMEQNNKMKSDLNFAKQLQHKILPENKIYNGVLKIQSKYIPCEMLGGDVYDVIQINDTHIGLYMADVAGHGVTSSMMTMFIRQTLKNLGERAIDPAVTLRYLYHRYRELSIDDQYYITIFYGVYHTEKKDFTYANAGHNCMPIVIGPNYVYEIEMTGLPICTIFKDVRYEQKSIVFDKGDKILFYTDGIAESYNQSKGFFQNHRVLTLCKENAHKDLDELIDRIIDEANYFATEKIKDDIAIMVGEIL